MTMWSPYNTFTSCSEIESISHIMSVHVFVHLRKN